MTKTVYNYHYETFEFLNIGEADESPLEADVYLLPAHSTEVEPPQIAENEAAIFDAVRESWRVVPDWRGIALYSCVDGSPIEVSEIGQSLRDVSATTFVRPSIAHVWIDGGWVLSEEMKNAIDAESEAIKRSAFQAELDARMDAAVAIANPLDYANKRKKLPADKATRLAAYNDYIDRLAALEYSAAVEWPVQPE